MLNKPLLSKPLITSGKPDPLTVWASCGPTPLIKTIRIKPVKPNAWTDKPLIDPPVKATLTVLPIDNDSRALLAVRTFA